MVSIELLRSNYYLPKAVYKNYVPVNILPRGLKYATLNEYGYVMVSYFNDGTITTNIISDNSIHGLNVSDAVNDYFFMLSSAPANIPEVGAFCLSLISEVHQALGSTNDYKIVLGGGNALKLLDYKRYYPSDFDTLVIINPDLSQIKFTKIHDDLIKRIEDICIASIQKSELFEPIIKACESFGLKIHQSSKIVMKDNEPMIKEGSVIKIPPKSPFQLDIYSNYGYTNKKTSKFTKLNITEIKLRLTILSKSESGLLVPSTIDLIDFTVPLYNYELLPAYWAIYKNNTQLKYGIFLPTDIALYGAQRITELSEDNPDKIAKQQKRAKNTQVRLGHQVNEARRKGVLFKFGLNTNNTRRRILNRKNLTVKRTATRSNTNYIQKMIKKLNNSGRKNNNNALTVGNIYDTYLTD